MEAFSFFLFGCVLVVDDFCFSFKFWMVLQGQAKHRKCFNYWKQLAQGPVHKANH